MLPIKSIHIKPPKTEECISRIHNHASQSWAIFKLLSLVDDQKLSELNDSDKSTLFYHLGNVGATTCEKLFEDAFDLETAVK